MGKKAPSQSIRRFDSIPLSRRHLSTLFDSLPFQSQISSLALALHISLFPPDFFAR